MKTRKELYQEISDEKELEKTLKAGELSDDDMDNVAGGRLDFEKHIEKGKDYSLKKRLLEQESE